MFCKYLNKGFELMNWFPKDAKKCEFIGYSCFGELIMLYRLKINLGGAVGTKEGLVRRWEQITVGRPGKI